MKKILFILISFTLLTLVGCSKDFLDTKPSESIDGRTLLSTIEGADFLITGTNALRFRSVLTANAPHYAFGERSFDLMLDGLCEDFYELFAGGWYTDRGVWQEVHWKNDNDAPNSNMWNRSYEIINNVNQLIDAIDKDLIQNGTQNEKDFWLAQALIYRAHYHHMLVQVYARPVHSHPNDLGIPINIKAINEPMARDEVINVYTQIFKDLHKADTLLTGNPVVPRNKSFASINVVHGLLARAYSCLGTTEAWPKVEHHANLAKQGHDLMTKDQFRNGFNAINSEWMWATIAPADELTAANIFFRIMTNGIGYTASWGYRNMVSAKVYEHADSSDARFYGSGNAGGQQMVQNTLGEWQYNKFYNPLSASAHYCYMRSAEMILLEAEAQIMQNNFTGARANLQILMDARMDGYDASSFADGALMAELKMQRRMEFWGEGRRWGDLKRWGEGVDRNESGGEDVLPPYIAPDRVVLSPNDPFWVFLIPRGEMDSNPLMIQNHQ